MLNVAGGVPESFHHYVGQGLAAAGRRHASAERRPGGFLQQLAAPDTIVDESHQPIARAGRRTNLEPQHLGRLVQVVRLEADAARSCVGECRARATSIK